MTCELFSQSYYPPTCDISKYGEGCEQCLGLFQANKEIFIAFGFVFLTLAMFAIYIKLKSKRKIKTNTQLNKTGGKKLKWNTKMN